MKTILLWFFVSYGTGGGRQILTYSPPFATLEECQRVQAVLNHDGAAPGICAQMRVAQ